MRRLSAQSRAIVGNGTWSSVQQMAQLGANSLIALLLIRELDVAAYGVYAYATTLSAIGVAVMTAGLSGLAVRELVQDREHGAQLVTVLVLVRETFALIGFGALLLVSLTSGEPELTAATALACLSLLGRAFDAPEMWFASVMRVRRTAVLRITAIGLLLAVRVLALSTGAGVWFFLAVFALEPLVGSVLILWRYARTPDAPGWGRPSPRRALALLRTSFPLLLSGLANQLNLRSDIIVLQVVLGSGAVGLYAAGARISELAYFLPVMFMNASLPVMLRLRSEHGPASAAYRSFVRGAYVRAFWLGVGVAAVVAVVGPLLVRWLFGPAYAVTEDIVRIHVLACPFVYMAAVYSKWIIAEGVLWQSVVRHASGAAVNVVANLALLPVMGVRGAAVATVASYSVASYLSCFLGRTSRPAGRDMSYAIAFPLLWVARHRPRRAPAAARTGPGTPNPGGHDMGLTTTIRRRLVRAARRLDARAYYRVLDRSFDREMQTVAAGTGAFRAADAADRNRYHLVRNTHMIEKGLTMRPRRGTFAAGYVEETVALWAGSAGALDADERAWTTDVLTAYFDATAGSPDPAIRRAAAEAERVGLLATTPGGSGPHHPQPAPVRVEIDDLVALAQHRRSVRWFLPDPVPRELVDAAVLVAREAPTACNRQPYRFVVVDDDRVGEVAAIPMGTRGYAEQLSGMVVVVGDWSAYSDERDRHLPYIDGALASMGLVLGLEAQGVATCCINWPDVPAREQAMRALLGLAAHERVLMLVAYGYADPTGTVPYSAKRELDRVRRYGIPGTSPAGASASGPRPLPTPRPAPAAPVPAHVSQPVPHPVPEPVPTNGAAR